MGGDGRVEISEPYPHHTPHESVPDSDPVEMFECGYHERIEGKNERRDDNGCGASKAWIIAEPRTVRESHEPTKKKSAKIQFDADGNEEDSPRQHDEDRHARMGRLAQKPDVGAQPWHNPEDDHHIDNSQHTPDWKSPLQSLRKLRAGEPEPERGRFILHHPHYQ